ncbi:response regulator [Segetibacter sp.]|jgi:CheY-like chemotaxis protein|uniref:response regulator n=1 Tax=Segetibacter sp. TaxID=2231182 RepID=UPI00261F4A83|nr:response regulator [Segetibacter sp.]MCW3080204.1 multi-sensor hybrid histidine kinase [Segetibacter sp.]
MLNNIYRDTFPELFEKVVLNVDDNEMNQLVISKIMENAGMKTITVLNGAEAIQKLNEGLKPDFILMDLEMPVMNGLQAAECIKREIDSQIPIIINSGAVSDVQKWKLKRLGITDFLEKPYSMKDIFSKLSKFSGVYQP